MKQAMRYRQQDLDGRDQEGYWEAKKWQSCMEECVTSEVRCRRQEER